MCVQKEYHMEEATHFLQSDSNAPDVSVLLLNSIGLNQMISKDDQIGTPAKREPMYGENTAIGSLSDKISIVCFAYSL